MAFLGELIIPVATIIVGLLFFWGMSELFFLDILGLGRRKAIHQLPKAAKKFGFKEDKSKTSHNYGKYTGTYGGYNFVVNPESSATIELHMDPVPGLEEIATYRKQTNFDSGNNGFDGFLKTRLVSDDLARKLRDATPFLEHTVQFVKRWKRPCNYFQIYKDTIYFSFKYGMGHYIPASVLEEIVPDLVKLADLLQAIP